MPVEVGVRHGHRYQAFYCEENVWHLAGDLGTPLEELEVAIITNALRACPLWAQRAAAPGRAVNWDYHVILLRRGVEVLDLDSRLPFPSPLVEYLEGTFGPGRRLRPSSQARFRVVSAAEYRARLDSDRSHMRNRGRWTAPPPPWPAIRAAGDPWTLEAALDLQRPSPGAILDLDGLIARYA